jgi:hypothetical protein
MKAFTPALMSRVALLLVCSAVAAVAGWAAAKWRAELPAKRILAHEEKFRKMTEAAVGRAEYVAPSDLVSSPATYDGKRVILAGIWSQGFEHSLLRFEGVAQDFWIWVDLDQSKVDGLMGDFSNRKKREDGPERDQNGHVSHSIVAEGTFHFHRRDRETLFGYGHMGVAEGYFLIDRLLEFEWTEKEPNQSPEPTVMSVTPPAAQEPRQP